MNFDMNISAPAIGIVMGGGILALALLAFILWRIEDLKNGKYLANSPLLRERHPGDEGALHVVDKDLDAMFGDLNNEDGSVDPVPWDEVEKEAGR